MTSDFVTILDGILRYNDETWEALKEREEVKADIKKKGEERTRRAGMILDVSADGYYNSEKCVADFVKVCFVSVIFIAFYGQCSVPAAWTSLSPWSILWPLIF